MVIIITYSMIKDNNKYEDRISFSDDEKKHPLHVKGNDLELLNKLMNTEKVTPELLKAFDIGEKEFIGCPIEIEGTELFGLTREQNLAYTKFKIKENKEINFYIKEKLKRKLES